ncbi:hypothetical protein ACP275_08G209900 [Erythranthe tilingii]
MVRVLADGENVSTDAGLVYMVGLIVLSISIMSMLIFACADDIKPRKRWGSSGHGGGVYGGEGAGCGGGCGGGGGGGGGGGE